MSITAPTKIDYTIPLFFDSKVAFDQSFTSDKSCGQPTYTLTRLSSTATTPIDVTLDANDLINAEGFVADNAGVYFMELQACLTIGAGSATETTVCDDSTFTLTIRNPCTSADIIEEGWTRVLTAAQLETDSLQLSDEITSGIFPWTNSV